MSPVSAITDDSALATVAEVLACPECGHQVRPHGRSLHCANRHSFDIARQGYVSLLTGASTKMTGDTAAMLDARGTFQHSGHFATISEAVVAALRTAGVATSPAMTSEPPAISGSTETAAANPPGADQHRTDLPSGEILLDIGAGTGYYLSHVLDALPTARGIALDVSKAAGRRGARAHPRAAAVVADAWRGLPVRDGTLEAALSVFAPRNPAAVAAALRGDGCYVVVTPTPSHLEELIEPLGMVQVDPDKERRLDSTMSGYFDTVERHVVEYPMRLGHADIARLVAMGPSAHHTPGEEATIVDLPAPFDVTASVTVGTYRPLG